MSLTKDQITSVKEEDFCSTAEPNVFRQNSDRRRLIYAR